MELRHKASRRRALKLSMAMWQLGNVMWNSLLIILLSNIKASAQLMKIDYDPDKPFNLSKGLYDCTMENRFPLLPQRAWSVMEVIAIQPQACLCCTQSSQCELCLQVWLKLRLTDEEDLGDDEDGDDDEGSESQMETSAGGEDVKLPTSKETSEDPASLKLCYTVPNTLPHCYEVRCAVQVKRQPPGQCEMLGVVLKPKGLMPGVTVHVTAEAIRKINATIIVPRKDEICGHSQPSDVKDCAGPPRVLAKVVEGEVQMTVPNTEAQVGMCLKSQRSWICKNFSNIPLYSVTPCMCIQAWWKTLTSERSESCPFNNISGTALENLKEVLHQNVLANLTTSVKPIQTHSGLLALSWNVSAPCQVSLEVVLCHMGPAWSCHNTDHRLHIPEGHKDWTMEGDLWRVSGAFVNINCSLPLCIKVKVMGKEIGPFCQHFSRRWHWSVPVVAVVLLFMLMILGFYSRRDTLEKWIQKWHSTSLFQGGRGHVLLLHPSCEDPALSEMVCLLGSTLKSLGFSVSLDLWSHTELGSLGPVPWLHSQMDQLRSTGGRALVVLSHAALERAEEWSWPGRRGSPGGSLGSKDGGGGGGGGPAPSSPSSPLPTDVFSAALCCLLEDHQRGWAKRRYSLVQFDSHGLFAPGTVAHSLPGLFQGLGMYSLPTQSRPFLDALMEHGGVTARSWRWQSKWQSSWLSRALTKSQLGTGEHLSQILENSGETAPLQP